MNQISLFEAKVANGNGEQTLSRDVYWLGCRFDFYRMLSFYFTTVGFYFSSMVTVLTVYVFLYGRLYLVLSGIEKRILEDAAIRQSKALEEALATQSVFQLGLLLVLPMVMEIGLERGSSARAVVFTLERDPLFLFLRSSGEFDARAGASACKTSGSVQSTLERESVSYARAGLSTLERRVDYISP
ncbi:hypothetical protein HYC85_029585 [Camellia sinensis]|uniref:Glycosyl transferase 48 domain-containing protein n=1 Tax=Camellia sinensis TaxID=4442 RepID=A0A7J7G2B0_CAMSI|nr:hypothetical protein HYC85_029585 [Camellia sinensis]